MVRLISAEGHEFYVHKKCALVSGTIKAMLGGQFAESRGEVRFPEIPGIILERVVQYLYYKVRYTNSSQRVPNFNIEPEMSLELLMAANCKRLPSLVACAVPLPQHFLPRSSTNFSPPLPSFATSRPDRRPRLLRLTLWRLLFLCLLSCT